MVRFSSMSSPAMTGEGPGADRRWAVLVGVADVEEVRLVSQQGPRVAVLARRGTEHRLDGVGSEVIAVEGFDVDGSDIDAYDRAVPEMAEHLLHWIATLGPPEAVLGLHEHTILPAARLREIAGVDGVRIAVAERCRDKIAMKEAVSRAGVKTPRYLDAEGSGAGIVEGTFGADEALVLKPRSGAAALGVRIFSGVPEFLVAHPDGRIPVGYELEEFIDEVVCHIDGVVSHGEVAFCEPAKYLGTPLEYQRQRRPLGSVSLQDAASRTRAREFAQDVLGAVGLEDGVFHLEAFLAGDEFVFLEVANRVGGGPIRAALRMRTGIDLLVEAIKVSLGLPPSLASESSSSVTGWAMVPAAVGEGAAAQRIATAELPTTVIRDGLPTDGSPVTPSEDVWNAAAMVLFRGATAAEVENDVEKAMREVVVTAPSRRRENGVTA